MSDLCHPLCVRGPQAFEYDDTFDRHQLIRPAVAAGHHGCMRWAWDRFGASTHILSLSLYRCAEAGDKSGMEIVKARHETTRDRESAKDVLDYEDAAVFAAERGHVACVRLLIHWGAKDYSKILVASAKGSVPMMVYARNQYASGMGYSPRQFEHALRAPPFSAESQRFRDALSWALSWAHDVGWVKTREDMLQAAARAGREDTMLKAYEWGAIESDSALIAAAGSGNQKCMELALKYVIGCDRNKALYSALVQAARSGKIACMNWAKAAGARVTIDVLHWAARHHHRDCMQLAYDWLEDTPIATPLANRVFANHALRAAYSDADCIRLCASWGVDRSELDIVLRECAKSDYIDGVKAALAAGASVAGMCFESVLDWELSFETLTALYVYGHISVRNIANAIAVLRCASIKATSEFGGTEYVADVCATLAYWRDSALHPHERFLDVVVAMAPLRLPPFVLTEISLYEAPSTLPTFDRIKTAQRIWSYYETSRV